jgi:hypothetical protein
MMIDMKSVPSVSVTYARNGTSTKANALGMRPMHVAAFNGWRSLEAALTSPRSAGA